MKNLILRCLALGGLLSGTFLVGCGGVEAPNHFDANAAYNSAEEAMDSGDFAGSIENWTNAIDSGSLNPDQYADAIIRRGECFGRTGDFAAAHADLDIAERGAPDLDRVYATRAFVFTQEGKKKEASAAMAKAKKENRNVKELK